MVFDFVFFVRDRAPGAARARRGARRDRAASPRSRPSAWRASRGASGRRLAVALALVGAVAAPRPRLRGARRPRSAVARSPRTRSSRAPSRPRRRGRAHRGTRRGRSLRRRRARGDRRRRSTGNVFAWARRARSRGRDRRAACTRRARSCASTARSPGSGYIAAEVLSARRAAHASARDAFGFAAAPTRRARVARDLHFHGEELDPRRRAWRATSSSASAGRVRIADGASVGRDLHAAVAARATLEVAAGAAHRRGPRDRCAPSRGRRLALRAPGSGALVRVAAALAFGVALYALLPGPLPGAGADPRSFLRLLGLGFAALVGRPPGAGAGRAHPGRAAPRAARRRSSSRRPSTSPTCSPRSSSVARLLRRSPAEELPGLGELRADPAGGARRHGGRGPRARARARRSGS